MFYKMSLKLVGCGNMNWIPELRPVAVMGLQVLSRDLWFQNMRRIRDILHWSGNKSTTNMGYRNIQVKPRAVNKNTDPADHWQAACVST